MTNIQLYLAIGIPVFVILCSLVIGILQLNRVAAQLNGRLTSLESNINTRFSTLDNRINTFESDIKTLVKVTSDFDVRVARLEERLAR
jgi:hypothetical protein